MARTSVASWVEQGAWAVVLSARMCLVVLVLGSLWEAKTVAATPERHTRVVRASGNCAGVSFARCACQIARDDHGGGFVALKPRSCSSRAVRIKPPKD